MGISKTRCRALWALAERLLAGEINFGAALPLPSGLSWPKSNSGLSSGVSLMTAAKGLPILLRNPCRGPTWRFGDEFLDLGDFELPAGHDLPRLKSHFWHWNFL